MSPTSTMDSFDGLMTTVNGLSVHAYTTAVTWNSQPTPKQNYYPVNLNVQNCRQIFSLYSLYDTELRSNQTL